MVIENTYYQVKGVEYGIRSARIEDAHELSVLRETIDGETENLDREKGEGLLTPEDFRNLILSDSDSPSNLFLVAVVQNKIVGFLRCEGANLKRFAHKVELGICILKEFWNIGIGRNLLNESLKWADNSGIKKITLRVVETNKQAIRLYQSVGFEVEGILKRDRMHSDGNFYDTIVMGRWKDE